MCHRFVNFETLDYDYTEEQVMIMVNEYLRTLTQAEGASALLYSKFYSEIKDNNGSGGVDRERSWTICIVYSPKRNQKIEQAIRAQASAGVCLAVPHNCKVALLEQE